MKTISNHVPDYIGDSPVSFSIYSVTNEAPHYHSDALEFVYVLKGSAEATYITDVIPLKEGDLLSIDCNSIHHITSGEDNFMLSIYINLKHDLFEERVSQLFYICEPNVIVRERVQYVHELCLLILSGLRICMDVDSSKPSRYRTLTNIAKEIMQCMYDHFHMYDFLTEQIQYSPANKLQYEKIMLFINENFFRKITVVDLGHEFHFSPNYISRFFKSTALLTFKAHLRYIRTIHAQYLLSTTELSISEVAAQCGFSDTKYLFQNFRKFFQTSPNQYRSMLESHLMQSEPNKIINLLQQKEMVLDILSAHMTDHFLAQKGISEKAIADYIPSSVLKKH